MAKKRSNSKTTKRFNSPSQRNIINPIASPRLLRRISNIRTSSQMLLSLASLNMQDNRSYTPRQSKHKSLSKPAQLVTGFVAPATIQKNKPLMQAQMQFSLPKKTTVCVRRGVRKEVLHALNKTGKGSGRPRRYTENSKIKC